MTQRFFNPVEFKAPVLAPAPTLAGHIATKSSSEAAASAAQTAAEATAAADATTKASAAQAAAIAAAATDATTKSSAAQAAAIVAAAADATTKASAAQAAAIAAAATDATTKANAAEANAKTYADTVASGVRVVGTTLASSVTNVDVATGGLLTLDTVALVDGDKVLLMGQTNPVQNGPWVAHAGAWTRPADFANGATMKPGFVFIVTKGTLRGDTGFVLLTDGLPVIGTDALTFDFFQKGGNIQDGAGLTKTGNDLHVNTVAGRTAITGDAVDVDTNLLPSPLAGDVGKFLKATAAGASVWTSPTADASTQASPTQAGFMSPSDKTTVDRLTTQIPMTTVADAGERLIVAADGSFVSAPIPVASASAQGELSAADYARFDAAAGGVANKVTATMNDNQAVATPVHTGLNYDPLDANGVVIDFCLKRGGTNLMAGRIFMVNSDDGASMSISTQGEEIGTVGVTFSIDYTGGLMRLLYTSTSTGAQIVGDFRPTKLNP